MSEFPSQRLLLTRNDNKKLGENCTTYWCIACVAVAFLIRNSTVCWVRMRIKFSSRTDDVVVQGEVSCVSSGEVSQFFFKGSTWQSEHVYDFFFAAFCREKRSPQSLFNKARYLNFCSRKRSEGNISASLRTYWELRSHVSSFQPLLFPAVNPRGILFVNVCTSLRLLSASVRMASRALKKFCIVHLIVDRAYEQRLGHRVKIGTSPWQAWVAFTLF